MNHYRLETVRGETRLVHEVTDPGQPTTVFLGTALSPESVARWERLQSTEARNARRRALRARRNNRPSR